MTGNKMVNGARVDYWTAINFSPWKTEREVQKFCNDLVVTCNSIGMDFKKFPCVALRVADSNNIESALRNLNQEIQGALNVQNKRLQLLIVILPDTADSYGKIKKICETELVIVSQCLQSKYISKAGKAYRESVALKINVKVGGRNTVLNDTYRRQIPYLTDKATIIFGADVTHPPSGDHSSPSIAAVVASMDWPEVTKYKGLVSAQAPRKEMISDLYRGGESPGGMIRELLISFRQSTGKVPQRIIFYRDGVSDGQFGQVLLYELDQIKKACYSFGENYKPAVTFVVVQKRHHTRLLPEVHHGPNMHDPNMTVRSGNILPGTVVDWCICHPTQFDFFLSSHAGILGTTRLTHYHVLYDENKFTADGIQTLTNNLCYTYARCTRSVSIVPPAYYAHLAAFRARCYMEDNQLAKVKENVKDFMFYC